MLLFVWPVEEGELGGLEKRGSMLESAREERGKY